MCLVRNWLSQRVSSVLLFCLSITLTYSLIITLPLSHSCILVLLAILAIFAIFQLDHVS